MNAHTMKDPFETLAGWDHSRPGSWLTSADEGLSEAEAAPARQAADAGPYSLNPDAGPYRLCGEGWRATVWSLSGGLTLVIESINPLTLDQLLGALSETRTVADAPLVKVVIRGDVSLGIEA